MIQDLRSPKRKRATGLNIDRLPPHSIEAEQGVLGCILLSPQDSMAAATVRLQTEDAFYDLRHQTIYAMMRKMYNSRTGIDTVTLLDKLRDSKQLDEVGGVPYLASLQDVVPSAANLPYYLEVVIEKALLRKMIVLCSDTTGKAYEANGDVTTLIDEFERESLGVRSSFDSSNASEFSNIVDDQEELTSRYDEAALTGKSIGVQTGFMDFDRDTGGLSPTDMIVLAARPSVGKTSLAMNILQNLVIKQAIPVGFFSLEMSSLQLIHRLACGIARVDSKKAFNGKLEPQERDRLNSAHILIEENKDKIVICDKGGLSIETLAAHARRMAMVYDIKVLFIDYMQLMGAGGVKYNNRQECISAISRGIKALAKELNLPIVALSQLNREVDKDAKGRWPKLSDLRESGAIEQDADMVCFLHSEEENIAEQTVQVRWIVAKYRSGAQTDVRLTFIKPYTRFESSSKINDDDVPT